MSAKIVTSEQRMFEAFKRSNKGLRHLTHCLLCIQMYFYLFVVTPLVQVQIVHVIS